MNLTAYRVGFHCPKRGDKHKTEHVIRSPNAALDGRPLVEAYPAQGEGDPSVVAILGEIRHCGKDVVTPTLEQFFLELALQSV